MHYAYVSFNVYYKRDRNITKCQLEYNIEEI